MQLHVQCSDSEAIGYGMILPSIYTDHRFSVRSVIQPSSSSSWYDVVFCERIFVLYIENIIPFFYEIVNQKNCNSVKMCIGK